MERLLLDLRREASSVVLGSKEVAERLGCSERWARHPAVKIH